VSGRRAQEVAEFLAGRGRPALAEFVARQRWFGAKARGIGSVVVEDWAALQEAPPIILLLVQVDGDRYYVPLACSSSPPDDRRRTVAQLDAESIYDAHWEPAFGRLLLSAIAAGNTLPAASGHFVCREMTPPAEPGARDAAMAARPLSGEQSNTSMAFDRALIMKSIRRPEPGLNPDFEITHFLTGRSSFSHVARLAGWIEYIDRRGHAAIVMLLQRFIENTGDGWEYLLAGLRRLCESVDRESVSEEATTVLAEADASGCAAELIADLRTLGAVTGELHTALASDASRPEFRPEPVTAEDTRHWQDTIARDLSRARAELTGSRAHSSAEIAHALGSLERAESRLEPVSEALRLLVEDRTSKIRCHGDYHLGQVLKTADAFLVIDFEGEPARPLAERRAKHCPLRDVAGMLRSLNYAVHAIARERQACGQPSLLARLERWEDRARRALLDGYIAAASRSAARLLPTGVERVTRVCGVFELEKACYELHYELNNRPDWVSIPLAGISRILDAGSRGH
jgi:trehalose synthase-fused probable maltokinase